MRFSQHDHNQKDAWDGHIDSGSACECEKHFTNNFHSVTPKYTVALISR